jgi:hypothetical protein
MLVLMVVVGPIAVAVPLVVTVLALLLHALPVIQRNCSSRDRVGCVPRYHHCQSC